MYVFRNLFIEFFVVRRDWSYKSSNQNRILELLFIISFSHVEITENDWRVYGCDNSTISEVLRHISHVSFVCNHWWSNCISDLIQKVSKIKTRLPNQQNTGSKLNQYIIRTFSILSLLLSVKYDSEFFCILLR